MQRLRADPRFADLVRDTYIDEDVSASATRFEASGEWQAVHELLKPCLPGATVIDLGAGNGIASRALANAGAGRVFAVEPDSSDSIGRGANVQIATPGATNVVCADGGRW